ncbi:hypothetical protein BGZ60DRAFT_166619 [Tricladium varicosporioides]|nr:hypothetical protein BGZ60DRAFT_166619 [Hymenoscyphus varicosporioides]
MGKNKKKAAAWDEEWIEDSNATDYEDRSRPKALVEEVSVRSVQPNFNSEQSELARMVPLESLNAHLQPYTERVHQTTHAFSTFLSSAQVLNDLYIEHAQSIEIVQRTHQQLVTLQEECSRKNEKILQQKHAIAELQGLSEDREAELARRTEIIEADELLLLEKKKKMEKKLKDADKSIECKEAQMKLEMKKTLDERKIEQENQHQACAQQLLEEFKNREENDKQQLNTLSSENRKLSEDLAKQEKKNLDLKDQLALIKEELEDVQRAKASYREDKERLELKLKAVRNEFYLTTKTEGFYTTRFAEIATRIEKTATEYFTDLPDINPEHIHTELISLDCHFNSIPISQSEISRDLRIAHTQRIISSALFTHIWQPFSTEALYSKPEFASLLHKIATKLSHTEHRGNRGRADHVWRVLTMRALRSLDSSTLNFTEPSPEGKLVPSGRANSVTQDMMKQLKPLITPAQSREVESALIDITEAAIDVWTFAQTDNLNITANTNLEASSHSLWRSQKYDPLEPLPDDKEGTHSTHLTRPRIFTLFPTVTAIPMSDVTSTSNISSSEESQRVCDENRETILHPGIGLPELSTLMIRGKGEKEEFEAMVQGAKLNIRRTIEGSERNSIRKSGNASMVGTT